MPADRPWAVGDVHNAGTAIWIRRPASCTTSSARRPDAIRTTPTFTTATDGPAPLNGDLLALLARERDIIAELRRPADPIEADA